MFKKKSLFIAILTVLCALSFIFAFNWQKAYATNSVDSTLFLPTTELEYDISLNSPQEVLYDNGICAVIQNNNELLISKNGGAFIQSSETFTSLQQIKRLDENTLLISDEAKIYKIDLSTDGYPKEVLNYQAENVTCNLFDYKDGILVGNYSSNTLLYVIENGVAVNKSTMAGVLAGTPVCINQGFIYYVNTSSKLCKRSTDLSQTETELVSLVPQKMITDGNFIYALCSDGIYRVDIENKTSVKLVVDIDEGYDLGKLTTPSGLCFKGGNLLISDSTENTLQEFKISENTLVFTGYAVATGKTAYNRIGKSANEIEFNAGRVAVLNNSKKILTVVNDINGNLFDRENFALNLIFSSGDTFIPDTFALGENSALLVNKTAKTARIYNFENKMLSDIISFTENATDSQITDVTWQNGKYFISQRKWDDPEFKLLVYSANELSTDFDKIIDTTINSINYPLIAVDVFENVFVTSEYDNCIFKYSKTDYTVGTELSLSPTGIKKLATDLTGGLFALKESSVIYYDQVENKAHEFSLETSLKANSFAMSFESNKVFFIYDDLEYTAYSSNLPTLSLDEITVPTEFVIDGENGVALNDLAVYSAKDGANIYSLEQDGNAFNYKGLIQDESIYGAFICGYQYSKSFESSLGLGARQENFILLVGKDISGFTQIYLMNNLDALAVQKQTFDPNTNTAYTTTGVRAYYLPIITQDALFTLKANSEILTLDKGTKITVNGAIEFLGTSFYYATVNVNGTNYSGYIPVKFTAKVLSQNYPETTFTVRKVKNTNVYLESGFTTLLTTLTEGTEVRVLEKTDAYAKIAYLSNGDYIIGYVSADSFLSVSNNTLRNVLIILAITVSICVTSLFLLLRKKS
ncbi:MAG: hypothetical protein IJY57_04975 [Clostridia bacterium]|nr:hypothetical protein [Clostridia bacterium]